MNPMTLTRNASEWTVHDLADLPDDGLQYELLDGLLIVSPAPVPAHQRVVMQLGFLLVQACPEHLEVFPGPLDWQPDARTSLQPDLLVVRRDQVGIKNLTRPMELAVEVLSPATHRKDRILKASRYAEGGIGSYWLVNPGTVGDDGPSATVHHLRDGEYVPVAHAQGDEVLAVDLPFSVSFTPAQLAHA